MYVSTIIEKILFVNDFFIINKNDMNTKQARLLEEATDNYLMDIYDLDEIIENLRIVNFVKRFFTKLHDNKLINIQLLVNHEILLYNVFKANWITNYQLKIIPKEHQTYLKTILLYIGRIDINDKRFIDIPFSFDLDYLLQTKSKKPSYLSW